MMFRPIRQLADRFNVLQMGIGGSERVFKILDTNQKIADEGKIKLMAITVILILKMLAFIIKTSSGY